MNIWHDINPDHINENDFIAVVEIPKGSKNKYELDKETGFLKLDRTLYTATHYPANYGFIPRTYADDNDPLDVMIICSEPIHPMTLVRCYPVGVISMLDDGKKDEKRMESGAASYDPRINVSAVCLLNQKQQKNGT